MKKVKKCLALALALSLLLAATSCGSTDSGETSGDASGSGSGATGGDSYPSGTISFVVPYAAGDGVDTTTRALLDYADFPVTTLVENISGGSGTIGLQSAFGRDADGYTVALLSNGPTIAQPLLNDTLSYTLEDWEILTITGFGTFPSDNPSKCIDYIMQLKGTPECEVVGSQILRWFKSGDVTKASDHLPVMLDIKLPPKQ